MAQHWINAGKCSIYIWFISNMSKNISDRRVYLTVADAVIERLLRANSHSETGRSVKCEKNGMSRRSQVSLQDTPHPSSNRFTVSRNWTDIDKREFQEKNEMSAQHWHIVGINPATLSRHCTKAVYYSSFFGNCKLRLHRIFYIVTDPYHRVHISVWQ